MHSGQKHCCSTTVTHEEAGTSYPTSSAVSCRYSSMPGLSVLHSSSPFPKIYLLFCFLYPFLSSMKKNTFSRKTKFLHDNHAKEQDLATTTKEKRSTNTNSHPAWTDMGTRNERKPDSKGHRPNYMQRKICRGKELVAAHNVGHGWNTGTRKWWLSGKRLCMKWWNCSKSDAGVAEQFCEHTKSVELYAKWFNCITCRL